MMLRVFVGAVIHGPRLRLTRFVAFMMAPGTPLCTEARITHLAITRVESPTFEGMSFGAVGQYKKLVGRAFGEVDPHAFHNEVIADITLAPRHARGLVE